MGSSLDVSAIQHAVEKNIGKAHSWLLLGLHGSRLLDLQRMGVDST